MSNILKATRQKIRYQVGNGNISVEGLWDISYTRLGDVIRSLKKGLNLDESDGLDFLDDTPSKVDEKLVLAYEVAKEIYLVRKEERIDEKTKADKKKERDRLSALLARKQNEKEEALSEAELLERLKALE